MMTKTDRLKKASGNLIKNVLIVGGSAVITGVVGAKSKDALREIRDSGQQLYNILYNSVQKW